MKPDWDNLMNEFKDSPTALIADVDCTAEGQSLCQTMGVQGYPTIKYGDPSDLQDYQGGRDYASLKSFAEQNLKPMCSVSNIDLCDDEKKKQIEGYQSLSSADLDTAISAEETKLKNAEQTFKSGVSQLQATYEKLMKEKEDTIAAVKASGLGLMKSVANAKAKAGNDEL